VYCEGLARCMEELSGALSPGEDQRACGWSTGRCVRSQYIIMEGYHVALLSELDVQARGGGGAAERLHASCRSLGAVAEVEGLERGQAAQCSNPYVRYVDTVAVAEAETRERRQAAHCPHALVCHRAAKEEVERVQSGCLQLAALYPSG
jgi:hypothetical protein